MFTHTQIETTVLSTISKVLILPAGKLAINDDYIKLGVNTSRATQIATILNGSFPSLGIKPMDILGCRTASGLIDFLHTHGIG